ncbi:hypothetical protein SSX86_015203 [Deinandra increscens subsp. villosa]|uniref:Bifunctional inhibitor/plant lipid transfer protein/seed storage helical domain-containing protein n=1 Tax=Deinandra increscens subsp. villosa TaxID=3103831 RepID=A0AAP0GZ19_9ASTR
MVKLNNTITTIGILVALVLAGLPCSEALSPMGAPVMSPGVPMTMAPVPAPAPLDCATALTNVSDCLSFVATGSNMTVPDKACCPEFAGLLESNPICLCDLVGQAENLGVDLSRALMLPDVCKLETPSLDSCPGSPSSAPTPGTPSEAPGSASEAPGSTAAGPGADGGSASSPAGSGTGGGNGASSTAVHDISTIICSVVAIFIAYYF